MGEGFASFEMWEGRHAFNIYGVFMRKCSAYSGVVLPESFERNFQWEIKRDFPCKMLNYF